MKTLVTDRFGNVFTVQHRSRPRNFNTGKLANAIALNMTIQITHATPPDGNRHALAIDSQRIDGHTYRIFQNYIPGNTWHDVIGPLSYVGLYQGMSGGILFNRLCLGGFVEAVRL